MNVKVQNVFQVGDKIEYEYDFGSTTWLVIDVKAYRTGKAGKAKIRILCRNDPPKITCDVCEERNAVWVAPEYMQDDDVPFLFCDECLRKLAVEEGYIDPEDIDNDESYCE